MACWGGILSAAYTYFYTDNFASFSDPNWYRNEPEGTLTFGASGLQATGSGSLIYEPPVPGSSNDYEVKTTLNLVGSGGDYLQYLRASENALYGAQGTFYAVRLDGPAFDPDG